MPDNLEEDGVESTVKVGSYLFVTLGIPWVAQATMAFDLDHRRRMSPARGGQVQGSVDTDQVVTVRCVLFQSTQRVVRSEA